eukprot:10458390-Lingulodinium_polyedra.AAC.1
MQALRTVAGVAYSSDGPSMPDRMVMAHLRAPPLEAVIRAARLAMLDRLARVAPPYLAVLIDEAG